MANLNFFAAHDDLTTLCSFLFALPTVHLFDLASQPEEELREYRSLAELEAVYVLGQDKYGKGGSLTLQIWSPLIMPVFPLERISLNPRYVNGHTFRYTATGGGLMQLYLGGIYEKNITKSYFGHFSEKGAAKWGREQEVDWQALAKLSNKIQYHIRSRMAVVRVAGRPVLPHAYALAKEGYLLVETAGTRWHYELPPIVQS